MSATGRGAERIANDNYPTPAWAVRRMLEAAPWESPRPLRIVEPCAGEGAIVRVLREHYPHAMIGACDIRKGVIPHLAAAGASNLLEGVDACLPYGTPLSGSVDLELTNPPFSIWQRIAAASLKRATWTALLLRIGAIAHMSYEQTIEGVGKQIFVLPTPSLYVLPQRPQFVRSSKCVARKHRVGGDVVYYECGWRETAPIDSPKFSECPQCGGKVQHSSSDASEYAWFVWGPQSPRVEVLTHTPLAERKTV